MRLLLLTLLLGLGAAFGAVPATAHAVLQATEPADRAVLARAPPAVTLSFSETITPISVQVLDASGKAVARAASVADGRLTIPLPADLADGAYLVSWRVTSVDSHPVAGSLMFAVGPPPASWSGRPSTDDGTWQIVFAVARATLSATLLLATGGALFLVLVRPAPSLHPLLTRLAWCAIALSLLVLGLQGGVLRGGSVADLLLASTWRLGASTTRGVSTAIAVGGLAILLLALRLAARPLLLLGALVALSSVTFSGHSATASPRWLSAPLLALHVALAAFWIGSLIPLLDGLARSAETKRLVTRFSTVAVIAVPILIFCGAGLVFRHITSWEALAETHYGALLLLKLALVLPLLLLAAVNKWMLTPRLPRSIGRLASAIRVELLLGFAILAVTALLSQTPPPASLHAHEHDEAHRHGVMALLESGSYRGELEVAPGMAGRNLILVRLDLPTPPKEVTIELAQPDAGIQPIRRTMSEDNGTYVLDGPELAVSGRWRMRIDVLITDFDKAIFEAGIPIR